MDRIQIDHLHMNIPGLTQEEANGLGRDVMERLENYLPDNLPQRSLSDLNIQIHIPQDTAKERLADVIARQMAKSLQ